MREGHVWKMGRDEGSQSWQSINRLLGAAFHRVLQSSLNQKTDSEGEGGTLNDHRGVCTISLGWKIMDSAVDRNPGSLAGRKRHRPQEVTYTATSAHSSRSSAAEVYKEKTPQVSFVCPTPH